MLSPAANSGRSVLICSAAICFTKSIFLISGCNSNKKNEESTDNLNNRGRKPPENQFYRQLEIPDFDIKLTGYFIGENGKNFKRITNMAGVKYIWWDSNIKKIEIWGPESKLNLACNILKDHYKFIENRFKT